jgi:hypothetical protein
MGVEDAVTDIPPQETVSSARHHIAVLEDASAMASTTIDASSNANTMRSAKANEDRDYSTHGLRTQTPRAAFTRTWVAPASWSGPPASNEDAQAS